MRTLPKHKKEGFQTWKSQVFKRHINYYCILRPQSASVALSLTCSRKIINTNVKAEIISSNTETSRGQNCTKKN